MRAGQAKAEYTGTTAHVRIRCKTSDFEPWQLMEWCPRLASDGGERAALFAWRGPAGDRQILAWGALEVVTTSGDERFGYCRYTCSAHTEQEKSEVPLWVGGLAFEPSAHKGGVWQGWPAACFYLPRLMAYKEGPRTELVLTARPGEATEDIQRSLDRLCSQAKRHILQSKDREDLSPPPGEHSTDTAGRGRWIELVNRAKGDMGSSMEKVVLARGVLYEAATGHHFDVANTLRRLAQRHPAATVFCLRPPDADDDHAFVGATPETLIRCNGDQVETSALAGTAARGSTDAEEFLHRDKERHEHRLVVEALRSRLGAFCSTLHADPAPRVKELADVVHLETRLHGTLSQGTHLLSLAEQLHPTPAVGGTPRRDALRWIKAWEGLERGFYAGPLGYFDGQGNGHFAVALRSALIRQQLAVAFVGAGITAASDAEAEWRETKDKLRTMDRSLSLRRREDG